MLNDHDEIETGAGSGLPDFERDVARCDQMIAELERVIKSGGSFSASERREFVTAWKAFQRAKPGSVSQRKAGERLNRLAGNGQNTEELRAQLRRWIEQRRRLVDTKLKADASAKKRSGGGLMFPADWLEQ